MRRHERTLSRAEARAFYDRFGAKQDWQRFYEDPAVRAMIENGGFGEARSVVEFGCGTGRLGADLLAHHLPGEATYIGFDISATMVELASGKLAAWPGRAEVERTDGSMRVPLSDGAADRFVASYVLDLLSTDDGVALIAESRRVLAPQGRLCLVSLTPRAQRRWPA